MEADPAMIGEDGLCRCDAFDEPHVPGLVVDETYCETLYTEPTISPHLFGVRPDGSTPDRPREV